MNIQIDLQIITQNGLKSSQMKFSGIDLVMSNVEYQTYVLFCFQLRLLKTTTNMIYLLKNCHVQTSNQSFARVRES